MLDDWFLRYMATLGPMVFVIVLFMKTQVDMTIFAFVRNTVTYETTRGAYVLPLAQYKGIINGIFDVIIIVCILLI